LGRGRSVTERKRAVGVQFDVIVLCHNDLEKNRTHCAVAPCRHSSVSVVPSLQVPSPRGGVAVEEPQPPSRRLHPPVLAGAPPRPPSPGNSPRAPRSHFPTTPEQPPPRRPQVRPFPRVGSPPPAGAARLPRAPARAGARPGGAGTAPGTPAPAPPP